MAHGEPQAPVSLYSLAAMSVFAPLAGTVTTPPTGAPKAPDTTVQAFRFANVSANSLGPLAGAPTPVSNVSMAPNAVKWSVVALMVPAARLTDWLGSSIHWAVDSFRYARATRPATSAGSYATVSVSVALTSFPLRLS